DRVLDRPAVVAELVLGGGWIPGLEGLGALDTPAQLLGDLRDRGEAARAVTEVRRLELRRRLERGRHRAVVAGRAPGDEPALLCLPDPVQPQPLALRQLTAIGDHLLEIGLLAAGRLLVLRAGEAIALALQVADREATALE